MLADKARRADSAEALVESALVGRALLHGITGAKAAARLDSEGVCVLEGLWSDSLGGALSLETEALVGSVSYQTRDGYEIISDGDFLGPFANGTGSGPVLQALHRHPSVVAAVRTLTGRLLVPTSSAYLFYRPEDHTGLHTDLRKCELVLLTTVAGNLGPLTLHPGLAGQGREKLVKLGLETAGDPDGGIAMPSATCGATALRGRDLPHHRSRCRAKESGVVATLCYQAAF